MTDVQELFMNVHELFMNIHQVMNFNSLGGGLVKFFFKVRVSIRTCVPNLGTVRRERFLTIDNPLNPPWVGWVKLFC